MYLAITLSRLEDFDNAFAAYDKAIEMESDYLFHLNYAITLFNGNEQVLAAHAFIAQQAACLAASAPRARTFYYSLAPCLVFGLGVVCARASCC